MFTSPPPQFRCPSKIISLVPSITELLWHLGLERETIGITKFCVHPRQWLHEKKRIGGTKNLHVDEIISLQPHLVIASREENVKEQVESIAKHVPVFLTDVVTLEDAYQMISDVGQLTGKHKRAEELVINIKDAFLGNRIPTNDPSIPTSNHLVQATRMAPPTIYLIWKDPFMTIGGDTFISNMMRAAGFENVYAVSNRYPEVSIEELANSRAELMFLSSEPYPFKEKHIQELAPHLPGKTIVVVDGEMFSWYGSRMLEAPGYFRSLRELLAKG